MADNLYGVVSPIGIPKQKKINPAPAVEKINGKRIGLCWAAFSNGDILLEEIEKVLHARYPDAETVYINPGKNRKPSEYADPTIGEIGNEARLDAAIATVGG